MELRTERLVLRELTVEDADAIAELANEWDVAKVLARVPYPYNRSDALQFIEFVSSEQLPVWGIVADRLIGVVGVEDELGYWLGKEFWGQGFATEAVSAAVACHFSDPQNKEIEAGHYDGNHASRRVLEKLGFAEIGVSTAYSKAQDKNVRRIDMLLTREGWEKIEARR